MENTLTSKHATTPKLSMLGTAFHTYKTIYSSLKRRSNEIVSLFFRFLEEEDTKFFQKLDILKQ